MTSPDPAEPLLALDQIKADVDGRATLKGVSMEVARGEIHALVGGQGAGKTALVQVVAGLIPKSSGRLFFDGHPLERHSAARAQRLGILTLHQEPEILPATYVPWYSIVDLEPERVACICLSFIVPVIVKCSPSTVKSPEKLSAPEKCLIVPSTFTRLYPTR